MFRKVKLLFVTLSFMAASVLIQGCSGSGFSGSSGTAPTPRPAKSKIPTTDESIDNSNNATAVKPPVADPSNSPSPDQPAKPEGPGSELTLTINDRDSKLDQFQVKNTVSNAWLPLTWRSGTQSIPGACSPKTKTTLSLQMHAKGGLFSSGGDLKTGSCSAPVTSSGSSSVNIGINPGCGTQKATFTLTCQGSSSLEVVP